MWLWVYYSVIIRCPIYPIFYLLKEDYSISVLGLRRVSRPEGQSFASFGAPVREFGVDRIGFYGLGIRVILRIYLRAPMWFLFLGLLCLFGKGLYYTTQKGTT